MQISWPQPNRTFGFADALGVTGLTGLLVARFVPVARLPFWHCTLRQRTGWPCLGCGLTRAADHLSHGNVAAAWEANPLGTVAGLLFAVLAAWMVLHMVFKLPFPNVALTPKEARAARVAVVASVAINYAFVIVKTKFPHVL